MFILNSIFASVSLAVPTVSTISVNGVPVRHPHVASGITLDRSGNLYTAGEDSVIRKITPAGAISIVAGGNEYRPPEYGYTDGAAADARFKITRGIVMDSNNNLFVNDVGNLAIRKIASGTYSVSTYSTGPLSTLRYQFMQGGIAIDRRNIIYIADLYLQSIFRITGPEKQPFYVMGPWASNWTSLRHEANFSPWAMVLDSHDNLYVVDNDYIRKITRNGSTYDMKTIANARTRLHRITIDSRGNLYGITKTTIMKISPNSSGIYTVSTFAGSPTIAAFADGTAANARFNDLSAITCDNRYLYVVDRYETYPYNPSNPSYSYIRKISLR